MFSSRTLILYLDDTKYSITLTSIPRHAIRPNMLNNPARFRQRQAFVVCFPHRGLMHAERTIYIVITFGPGSQRRNTVLKLGVHSKMEEADGRFGGYHPPPLTTLCPVTLQFWSRSPRWRSPAREEPRVPAVTAAIGGGRFEFIPPLRQICLESGL